MTMANSGNGNNIPGLCLRISSRLSPIKPNTCKTRAVLTLPSAPDNYDGYWFEFYRVQSGRYRMAPDINPTIQGANLHLKGPVDIYFGW